MRNALTTALAALAVAAAAAPAAAAEDVIWDVRAHTYLKGTAAGSEGGSWTSSSKWESEIEQQFDDIPATDDQESIVAGAQGHRVFAGRLEQSYALVTDLGTIAWTCTNNGEARTTPGGVNLNRDGDAYRVQVFVGFAVEQARSCTGFSSFANEITITPGPVVAEFTVPIGTLAKEGSSTHVVDQPLPCGEWTINQQTCDLRLGGVVTVTRRAVAPPEEEQEPVEDVKARMLRGGRGAAVEVTCASACAGTVTATAVARKRLKAQQVGRTSFSRDSAGTRRVEVLYGSRGTRAVRRRGAVVLDVRAGGQSRSVRLRAR